MAKSSRIRAKEYGRLIVIEFIDSAITDIQQILQITNEIMEMIDKGNKFIIIDFTTVRLLSSQALGALLKIHRKAKEAGGWLILAGLKKEILRIFKLTRLDKLFEIYNTRDDALTAGYWKINQ